MANGASATEDADADADVDANCVLSETPRESFPRASATEGTKSGLLPAAAAAAAACAACAGLGTYLPTLGPTRMATADEDNAVNVAAASAVPVVGGVAVRGGGEGDDPATPPLFKGAKDEISFLVLSRWGTTAGVVCVCTCAAEEDDDDEGAGTEVAGVEANAVADAASDACGSDESELVAGRATGELRGDM